MRRGGVADRGATPEGETGETTTVAAAAVEGGGTVGETGGGERGGETEDEVGHHPWPGIGVKGHQMGTNSRRPHQCISKLVVM